MKRKILLWLQFVFLTLFGLSLVITILQLFGSSNPLTRYDEPKSSYSRKEAFNPSLLRLNSMKKIELYCDSIYAEQALADSIENFESAYTDIVSTAVKDRFYHGYSYYGMNDNYMAVLISRATMPGLGALVIPDDILKHPSAACSQQSIVMMEILKRKGFKTRKVGFSGKRYGGHFAFEVFYEGSWHFNDPNLEPDKTVLDAYGQPDIAFLTHHPDVLLKAYRNWPKEEIMDIFSNFHYGAVNTFPAPRAIIFQRATAFLSYTIWLFFLIGFAIVRYKYVRTTRKARVYEIAPMRQIQPIPTAI